MRPNSSSQDAVTNQLLSNRWYTRITPQSTRRRRYSSAFVNNIWNAWSNRDNAAQDNCAGLLATMRTQVNNLKTTIDSSALDARQKPLVQRLIAESKQVLDALNPALLSQQASRSAAVAAPMQRTASEQSVISSNAKAALGCMAYLQSDQIFPGCAGTYQYIRERLEQIYRLMDGEYQVADVEGVRQQSLPAVQQAMPMVVAPNGPVTTSTLSTTPGASGMGQAPAPSPVAGLEAKPSPWNGTPNTTEDGQEAVGTGQNWFSTYGTTVEHFAERCSRWLRANGGGQTALVEHLRANTVPENVIVQTMPYVR